MGEVSHPEEQLEAYYTTTTSPTTSYKALGLSLSLLALVW